MLDAAIIFSISIKLLKILVISSHILPLFGDIELVMEVDIKRVIDKGVRVNEKR